MFKRLALIVSMLAAATPVQAAAPKPVATTPPARLKEIVHVRASAHCAEIATHANSAISTTLHNDEVLSQTISQLRTLNLDDGNPIHRRNGLAGLGDLAKSLMQQAIAGDSEVKRLRDLAASSTESEQKKELKNFADALGGALWRQHKVARDLNGFLASVDYHDMKQLSDSQRAMNNAVFGVADPMAELPADVRAATTMNRSSQRSPNLGVDGERVPAMFGEPTTTGQARAAAEDFQARIADISNDEAIAANNVTGAVGDC
ncbi:MAG: hypothetical protein M3M96_02820 [Candidatus Eremiobacteraeota bacterium]|nr:hypothetical protein [Candidatus Eremiobacteraeota bacterium]